VPCWQFTSGVALLVVPHAVENTAYGIPRLQSGLFPVDAYVEMHSYIWELSCITCRRAPHCQSSVRVRRGVLKLARYTAYTVTAIIGARCARRRGAGRRGRPHPPVRLRTREIDPALRACCVTCTDD
jgi:hypothetical protein